MTGTVERFNNTKGWGFIRGDDKEIYFVHYSSLSNAFMNRRGRREIWNGCRVKFTPVQRGDKYAAKEVEDCNDDSGNSTSFSYTRQSRP